MRHLVAESSGVDTNAGIIFMTPSGFEKLYRSREQVLISAV